VGATHKMAKRASPRKRGIITFAISIKHGKGLE
jgi:hypothetical protein